MGLLAKLRAAGALGAVARGSRNTAARIGRKAAKSIGKAVRYKKPGRFARAGAFLRNAPSLARRTATRGLSGARNIGSSGLAAVRAHPGRAGLAAAGLAAAGGGAAYYLHRRKRGRGKRRGKK